MITIYEEDWWEEKISKIKSEQKQFCDLAEKPELTLKESLWASSYVATAPTVLYFAIKWATTEKIKQDDQFCLSEIERVAPIIEKQIRKWKLDELKPSEYLQLCIEHQSWEL